MQKPIIYTCNHRNAASPRVIVVGQCVCLCVLSLCQNTCENVISLHFLLVESIQNFIINFGGPAYRHGNSIADYQLSINLYSGTLSGTLCSDQIVVDPRTEFWSGGVTCTNSISSSVLNSYLTS